MKILFVVLSPFNSNCSAMIRNKALIKGFLENGHIVDVISSSSLKNSYSDSPDSTSHENLNVKEIEILQYYKNLLNKNISLLNLMKRKIIVPIVRYVYHKLSLYDSSIFLVNKIKKSLYINKKYDVLISSSDPKSSHIAVNKMILNGLQYNKWIQYWGDPLALDITGKSLYPKFYKKMQENNILKNADKIVYVSPLTLQVQKKEFKQLANKMDWLPIPYSKEKIYEHKGFDYNSIKLGYFGDYKDSVRNIKYLYTVCNEEEIYLTIAGNSNCEYRQTSTISIYPRLISKKVEKLEKGVDVLVCILNIKGTQIPGKIYHYAATNRPILIILDGEYKEYLFNYLNSFNRFIFCDNNPNSIKQCIKEISLNKIKYEPLTRLSYKKVSKDFLLDTNNKGSVINSVLNQSFLPDEIY